MFSLFKKKNEIPVTVHIGHRCIHCNSCKKMCPEVFRLAALSVNGKRSISVDAETLHKLRNAENICPVACIDIREK